MLIFNLSLHRCGAQSLNHLLTNSGIKCLHFVTEKIENTQYSNSFALWQDYKKSYIEEYQVFSDFPVPLFVDFLFDEFPNETYICFTRNRDDWAKSVQRHLQHQHKHGIKCYIDALFYKQYADVDDIFSMSIEESLTAHDRYYEKLASFGSRIHYIDLDNSSTICTQLSDIIGQPLPNLFPKRDYIGL